MSSSDSHPHLLGVNPAVHVAALHAALIAWRKAERRHAGYILGVYPDTTGDAESVAGAAADRALHEVRKLVDSTLCS